MGGMAGPKLYSVIDRTVMLFAGNDGLVVRSMTMVSETRSMNGSTVKTTALLDGVG